MTQAAWRRKRGELPCETTSFVGRDAEIAAVRALFRTARMVTLLGPGGVGKTRIAVRAAARLAPGFRDGVRMVELAGVQDGELLAHSVGAAFGLPEGTGDSPLDMVVELLREEQSLLVLDTCEHLVDACAMLAEVLLTSCPEVRLLLTSRQALDVPAEHAYVIDPLEVPARDAVRGLEGSTAVRLFLERAAAARPGFALTRENRAHVAALCRRLDGIPLALELAAVRLRALSLEEVLRRLDDRFRVLGGTRTPHPRHQTLRTAIDWSHELCTPAEQALWARLSVFRGGFDLAAAERVCADDGPDAEDGLGPDGVVERLIGLVDKSVVLRHDAGDGERYRMLDTLREYGAERLAATGRAAHFAARHRDHYLALAEEGDRLWCGPDQVAWVHRLDQELDNFRGALEYSLATPGEEAAGLRLAVCLNPLWLGRGRLYEARRWHERAVALTPSGDTDTPDRIRACWQSAHFQVVQGEFEHLPAVLADCAERAARIGDRPGEAYALLIEGMCLTLLGAGDEFAHVNGQAVARMEALRDEPVGTGIAHYSAALHWARVGAYDLALRHAHRSLEELPPGEQYFRAVAKVAIGFTRFGQGELAECRRVAREVLADCHEIGDSFGTGTALELLSWLDATEDAHTDAAVVMGAASAVLRGNCALLCNDPILLVVREAMQTQTRDALGAQEFARRWERGEALGRDRAVRFALGESAVLGGPAADGPSLAALTRREREVADLVKEGLSNRAIAERLVISKRTVDAHVEHILAKLGFGSRGEIAALVRADLPAPNGLP
ncbi:ATP-binding protein [Streptomyces sp. NPDC060194]|uniref:ATP-binding protein n=1 Tax=Streptomyces sp. NPDC060194 TaxID=3347069 RepID=UPI00364CC048